MRERVDTLRVTEDCRARPRGRERASREAHHRVLAELPSTSARASLRPDFEAVDPHSHADHVDSFYVLEGEVEFRVGEEVFRAGPGSFVAAPQGVTHGFWNVGGTELRMVNIHAPNAGFIGRMRRG